MTETVLKKHQIIEALLRHLLRDGRWHAGTDINAVVMKAASCSYVATLDALWRIGGELQTHGRGGSEWRLRAGAQPRPPRVYARRSDWATVATTNQASAR